MTIPTYKSGILQVKAYRILQLHVSQTLEKFGINPTEWSILGLIYTQTDGIRFSSIADILQVERPLITMLVNGLESKGLVERHAHPKDKRAKLLFLTKKGATLVPQIEQKLREVLYKLLAGVSQDDLEAYRRVLEAIIANNQKE